eukprot:9499363-Pyramimonas_sp.AAC.1
MPALPASDWSIVPFFIRRLDGSPRLPRPLRCRPGGSNLLASYTSPSAPLRCRPYRDPHDTVHPGRRTNQMQEAQVYSHDRPIGCIRDDGGEEQSASVHSFVHRYCALPHTILYILIYSSNWSSSANTKYILPRRDQLAASVFPEGNIPGHGQWCQLM